MVWSGMSPYGLEYSLCSCIALSNRVWSYSAFMVLCGPITWFLVLYGLVWSCVVRIVLYSPALSCMLLYGPAWSCVIMYVSACYGVLLYGTVQF